MSDKESSTVVGRGAGRSTGARRWILAALPVAVVAFFLTGCSLPSVSGDSSSPADGSSKTTASEAEARYTSDLSKGCQKAVARLIGSSGSIGTVGAGFSKNDVKTNTKAYKELAAKLPTEIQPSYRTLAAAYARYATALAGAQPAQGKAAERATRAKLAAKYLRGESASLATAQIAAWSKKHCKTDS